MSAATSPEVIKEPSMVKQKEMIAGNYDRLTGTKESGEKVVSTFVPGNLNELIMCFDMVNNLPETNAIQNGMRKVSGGMIMDAEKAGHSEDVCTYVKADIGMMGRGNIAPNGKPMPAPDMLLLSYTGCFTFMKWFELLRHEYKCPTVMLQIPYQGDGKITKNMRDFVVKQLKEEVIPMFEKVSGVKFDIDRLREYLRNSAKAEDNLVWVLESAKNRPSPIDAYFGGDLPSHGFVVAGEKNRGESDGFQSGDGFRAGRLDDVGNDEDATRRAIPADSDDSFSFAFRAGFARSNIRAERLGPFGQQRVASYEDCVPVNDALHALAFNIYKVQSCGQHADFLRCSLGNRLRDRVFGGVLKCTCEPE